MVGRSLRIFISLIALAVVSCGESRHSKLLIGNTTAQCQGSTIREQLSSCVDGLTIDSEEDAGNGLTRFMLKFTQPVDHSDASQGSFQQVLMLLHRDVNRPMVLGTTGYSLYSKARMEPSAILDSNQITVEHRFFDTSTPENRDWSKLNIKQSADDFHRVVEQFKKVYQKKWINTGASKGGMTSVYHRRFYPNDLDGTVAYVAPHSLSDSDGRYIEFLEKVGGDTLASCRDDLILFQKKIFERKQSLANLVNGVFDHYEGGKLGALELAASEFRFVFWQYKSPALCEEIKNTAVEDGQLLGVFSKITGFPENYEDSSIDFFLSYYFQSATELGGPAPDKKYIESEISYPKNFSLEQFFPSNLDLEYKPESMVDVGEWVRDQSSKIMFVYGEFDPWSAGSFDVGSSLERGSRFYKAPGANHGAKIASLSLQDKVSAVKNLVRWAESGGSDDKAVQIAKKLEIDFGPQDISIGLRP